MNTEDVNEIDNMSDGEIYGILNNMVDEVQDKNLTTEDVELWYYLQFVLLERNCKNIEIFIVLGNT